MSLSIRWLRDDEAFIFRCDPCQIIRRLGRSDLLDLLGDAPLQNIAMRDEVRCARCYQLPTAAWPIWQKECLPPRC